MKIATGFRERAETAPTPIQTPIKWAAPVCLEYTPLTTDPDPVGDPDRTLAVWYRFTRGGLRGVDYGGSDVNTGQPRGAVPAPCP